MIGSRVGPYEVIDKLGEGGMGEVYRATDTKLKRDVAIKVLPAAFTADAERLARFEREAQLLAQLHHPNIASIFGLEESAGVRALVLELVEGPTLSERLGQGKLPVDESLAIARQIAEALEAAHEKGIVHRDLKPQNIKVTREGAVKVLDFGLAKALDPATGAGSATDLARSPTLMNSPTLTSAGTQLGMILGTAAYMAPEQARGGVVDSRADIWAFGVVLWEMLTGATLFAADTVADTLARVLTRELDLAELPDDVPPAIRTLLRRCLTRLPKNRLHSIADARIVLDDVLAGRSDAPDGESAASGGALLPISGAASGWKSWPPWVAIAAGGLLVGWIAGSTREPPAPRLSTSAATIRPLVSAGVSGNPAVSRDGRTLAFDSARAGALRVWIKDLSSGSESVIARDPSWLPRISPDGTSILFSSEEGERSDLYRLTLATREERLLARDAGDADWSLDGKNVYFIRGARTEETTPVESRAAALVVSDLESGKEAVLVKFDSNAVAEPRASPDGQRIALVMIAAQTGSDDRIGLFDRRTGKLREFPQAIPGRPGSKIRGLDWIDKERLALLLLDSGERISTSGRVAVLEVGSGRVQSVLPMSSVGWGLAVAASGTLIVGGGSFDQNLREVARGAADRWSEAELRTEGPFSDRQPAYSPDGRYLLFSSSRSGNLDIWRLDRTSGELRRLTDHEADDWDPAMSPDGTQLLFSANRTGRFQIWIADADGSSPHQVTDLENAQNPTMTGDSEWIVFVRQDAGEKNGIWRIRPDGSDARSIVLGDQLVPEVSPDGRYVAMRATGGRKIVRVADGTWLAAELPRTDRFRWSVEAGGTYLWMIGATDDGNEIRRCRFDPESGRVGPVEVVLGGDETSAAESLGVARDGSAFAFSSTANRRGQLLRIDGIRGLR